jgi:hypothetical protein
LLFALILGPIFLVFEKHGFYWSIGCLSVSAWSIYLACTRKPESYPAKTWDEHKRRQEEYERNHPPTWIDNYVIMPLVMLTFTPILLIGAAVYVVYLPATLFHLAVSWLSKCAVKQRRRNCAAMKVAPANDDVGGSRSILGTAFVPESSMESA